MGIAGQPKVAAGSAMTVADIDITILQPLQELVSALNVEHRTRVDAFFIRQEIDPGWRAFLLGDEAHRRLHKVHASSSIGRFVTINLHRSVDFRRWAIRLFDIWFIHAEGTNYRPLDQRGLRSLIVSVLGLGQEITAQYSDDRLLPWQTGYERQS
jgi:hypothetical protein